MKQHITIEQLNELSEKGIKRLQKWWKPEWWHLYFWSKEATKEFSKNNGGVPKNEPANMLWTNYTKEHPFLKRDRKQGYVLPCLSIGQMIEFLRENSDLNLVLFGSENVTVGNYVYGEIRSFSKQKELCDTLWETVKEILEK